MNRWLAAAGYLVDRAFLETAALMLPSADRAEWRKEWLGELWHVRRDCRGDESPWLAEYEALRFCLGAFQDVACLREEKPAHAAPARTPHGSAAQCVAVLSALLVLGFAASRVLPGVSSVGESAKYPFAPGLIAITYAGAADHVAAPIPAAQFLVWNSRRTRDLDGLAYYRTAVEPVAMSGRAPEPMHVAFATENLFMMLGLPLRPAVPGREEDAGLPALVLSDREWRQEFGGNPLLPGEVARVGAQRARIAGVAPATAGRLPGNVDAWLLLPPLEASGAGYVIAHLSPLGQAKMQGNSVAISGYYPDEDSSGDLCGTYLSECTHEPLNLYFFALFLAFLALPAVASVSLDEFSLNAHRLTAWRKIVRWGFLGAKFSLVLPAVYFVSLSLAYGHVFRLAIVSDYIQLMASFALSLAGLRWVLLDQHRRCPVCLHCVAHPAQVGLSSRTFLGWNGTELMCMGGHTLLHVPGLPTSWFSSPRWLFLDTSWEFLFAEPGLG